MKWRQVYQKKVKAKKKRFQCTLPERFQRFCLASLRRRRQSANRASVKCWNWLFYGNSFVPFFCFSANPKYLRNINLFFTFCFAFSLKLINPPKKNEDIALSLMNLQTRQTKLTSPSQNGRNVRKTTINQEQTYWVEQVSVKTKN